MKPPASTPLLAALLFGVAFTFGLHAQVPPVITYQGRIHVDGEPFTGTGQFKFALVDAGTEVSASATATAVVTSGFITAINVVEPGAGYADPPLVTITDTTGTGATATAQLSGGMIADIVVNNAGTGYSASPLVTVEPPPSALGFVTYWSNDNTSVDGSEPVDAVMVPVVDGLFTVGLGDDGLANMATIPSNVFDNTDVHLRIWFDDGVQGITQLAGDQRLTSTAYARKAGYSEIAATAESATVADAAGSVDWRDIANVPRDFSDNIDNDSTYSAGTGLILKVNTFSINTGGVGSTQLADDSVTASKLTSDDASLAKITGNTLVDSGDEVGIGTQNPVAKLDVVDESAGGIAVRGNATTTGTASPSYGVQGTVESQTGVGVYGENLAASSSTFSNGAGVYGKSGTEHSPGVLGVNSSFAGIGVVGRSSGDYGAGVRGEATGANGRYGLLGEAQGTNTLTYGVYGSAPGSGLNGEERTRGVYGYAQGSRARGVYGSAFGTRDDVSNELAGVYGIVGSTMGYGVYSEGNFGASGTKSFLQPHPTDPSLSIKFVSLEGNEAGTYFRGTGELTDGRAEIDIPEEWQLVTESEGITVQVTALGPSRLYVEERTRERIVVRGDVDCEFDFLVNGIRRGFADHQSLVKNTVYKPTEAEMPFGRQWPDALRDVLVENGTLNPDYTPNKKTAAKMKWKLEPPARNRSGLDGAEGLADELDDL